jgi:uncharacterized membrane protein
MSMGLMAGVFGLYAHTIVPGLGRTDDWAFVGAFRAVDRGIVNPWFLLGGFAGSLVFTALAAGFYLGVLWRSVLTWIVAALTLYAAVVVITLAVNVPLNNGIKGAGDLDTE